MNNTTTSTNANQNCTCQGSNAKNDCTCQGLVDTVYSTCMVLDDWDIGKPLLKAVVEAYGCGGAATITLSSAALFASMYTVCKTLAL